jgi:hypothetical protein
MVPIKAIAATPFPAGALPLKPICADPQEQVPFWVLHITSPEKHLL